MERLTIKYDDQNVPNGCCTFDRYGEPDDCSSCDEQCLLRDNDCDNCPIQKCFDKLFEYEDKIEAGLLIEVPCKVCAKVYRVWNDSQYVEYRVIGFTDQALIVVKGNSTNVFLPFDAIGDYVFLTKEEAERKLQSYNSKLKEK